MNLTFCFHCQTFVDLLENRELSCGHNVADQQTMYEFIVDKVDKVIDRIYTEQNINISEGERKQKAFEISMDLLGEWYSEKFREYL